MVAPKQPAHPARSSTYFVLLLVKILLVVVILLWLAPLVKASDNRSRKKNRKRVEQQFRAKRQICEREDCASWLPEENAACVSQCMSLPCHEEVYGNNPLELGEVDVDRYRKFEKCVQAELRELVRQGRRQRRANSK